ncbi:MAG: two-component system, chemotaxis family, protein-glutamate methylesterase/glutaminase [Bryobacterales bacterium]|jgi:two-component system chemotaxis response regulator CheB|nr:two-component system, chemotaxis family, protein-glutamate methylesterase/glutaminase [Bryobacterales bacterium]
MKHDLIVVGASSGGVEALSALASTLPPDLPAAIMVVLHIPPWSRSELPKILSRCGPLPARSAQHDELIQPGHIYVAPPDHHLLVEDGHTVLWRGPKENRHRPAVNTLFRSAAVSHGPRVTGVILTGALDDGSAGLWWVRRYGGATVVQDPDEAMMPDMPLSALEYVDSAQVARLSEMGSLLMALATGEEFDVCQQKRA